ncbi:MAG: hypothetical protein EOO65_04545, partial [Methanosarcinales archaeon]
CWVRPGWKMGAPFVNRTMLGILQYVVIRIVMSILKITFDRMGIYGEVRLQRF